MMSGKSNKNGNNNNGIQFSQDVNAIEEEVVPMMNLGKNIQRERKKKTGMSRSGYTCIRHLFCVLNLLMWFTACGVLGVGIWLRLSYGGYATLLPHYSILSADSLCIAAGVIIFIVAFFGCCGSWYQSRWMLITYFSIVVFVFLLEFLFATLAFVFRRGLSSVVREELKIGIRKEYNESQDNSLHTTWTRIHDEFRCCGVSGYSDWFDIAAWPGKAFVPDSCCKSQYRNITDCGKSGNSKMWHQKGCAEQVSMWFVERLHFVGIVGLVLSFMQLFGLISSMILFCTVRQRRASVTYRSYANNTGTGRTS